jgi:hypothetical protein
VIAPAPCAAKPAVRIAMVAQGLPAQLRCCGAQKGKSKHILWSSFAIAERVFLGTWLATARIADAVGSTNDRRLRANPQNPEMH